MISAVLIVLDEEYWIRQCLDALRTYPIGEVIIVDGGSSDQTVGIIRSEYPEVKLFERPMPLSFSDQRNFAKSQAAGEWILSIDADETLRGGETLEDLVRNTDCVGFSFPTEHINAQQLDVDPHIRLFVNRPDLNWEREVHEYLSLAGEALYAHPAHMGAQVKLLRWTPGVVVVHWAYTAPKEKLHAKAQRYMKFNAFGAGIQINSDEDLVPK